MFTLAASFGCAGNAFSYSSLSNRAGTGDVAVTTAEESAAIASKNRDADALNPNLYCSIDELKDNRRLENMYDEIQRRTTLQRRAAGVSSGEDPAVQDTLLPPAPSEHYTGGSASYDQLDFARPSQELKAHYASTSTLRSQGKSPRVSPKDKQRHSAGHLSQGDIPQVFYSVISRSIMLRRSFIFFRLETFLPKFFGALEPNWSNTRAIKRSLRRLPPPLLFFRLRKSKSKLSRNHNNTSNLDPESRTAEFQALGVQRLSRGVTTRPICRPWPWRLLTAPN